jgi:hypothetical protein
MGVSFGWGGPRWCGRQTRSAWWTCTPTSQGRVSAQATVSVQIQHGRPCPGPAAAPSASVPTTHRRRSDHGRYETGPKQRVQSRDASVQTHFNQICLHLRSCRQNNILRQYKLSLCFCFRLPRRAEDTLSEPKE